MDPKNIQTSFDPTEPVFLQNLYDTVMVEIEPELCTTSLQKGGSLRREGDTDDIWEKRSAWFAEAIALCFQTMEKILEEYASNLGDVCTQFTKVAVSDDQKDSTERLEEIEDIFNDAS